MTRVVLRIKINNKEGLIGCCCFSNPSNVSVVSQILCTHAVSKKIKGCALETTDWVRIICEKHKQQKTWIKTFVLIAMQNEHRCNI